MEADLIRLMHLGGHIDIEAHVEVLKLRVDDRRSAAERTRTEATGRIGNALADLEDGLLALDRAKLRLIENLGTGNLEQGVERRSREIDIVVSLLDVLDRVERDAGTPTHLNRP